MRKSTRIVKRIGALFLVVLMSIESFGALVSDNDGSAFITKGEFDSLKSSFQSQIDNYNTSVDSKIDGAIAAYLSGIQVKKKLQLEPLVSNYDEIFWTDTFLVKYQKKKWYDEATGTILNNSTVITSDPVWGCPPKERFHTLNAGLYKLSMRGTAGGSFITTFTKNAQEISVSYHAPWSVNTQVATSPSKTATGASGANNSLVNDYYWQSAPGGCGTMKNYLDKSLFGNIGASDTINVLYQALNGVYDKVLGTFNDAATVVELKDISATDTNKLKLQVERGDNIWIKIAPQNKSNDMSNSNDRVIKMKKLKIELEVGEEL